LLFSPEEQKIQKVVVVTGHIQTKQISSILLKLTKVFETKGGHRAVDDIELLMVIPSYI